MASVSGAVRLINGSAYRRYRPISHDRYWDSGADRPMH